MENDANNLEKTHNDLDTNDGKRSVTPIGKTKESKIIWSPDNEKILIEWCDVAQCYKWLNLRCHSKLSSTHAWFTIPAITLSTITGTASFAQSTLPPDLQGYAPAVIGTINIFVGILTTIQQYLKISEKNESHRVSAISWDKFARNIRIELAKTPQERDGAGHFIKAARQEFDRLMETSPSIDDTTIKEFYNKFQGEPNTKKRERLLMMLGKSFKWLIPAKASLTGISRSTKCRSALFSSVSTEPYNANPRVSILTEINHDPGSLHDILRWFWKEDSFLVANPPKITSVNLLVIPKL